MNSQEEFLPKWYPNAEPSNQVAKNVIAIVLIVLLTIFTLGIFTATQHISDTIKGRN